MPSAARGISFYTVDITVSCCSQFNTLNDKHMWECFLHNVAFENVKLSCFVMQNNF